MTALWHFIQGTWAALDFGSSKRVLGPISHGYWGHVCICMCFMNTPFKCFILSAGNFTSTRPPSQLGVPVLPLVEKEIEVHYYSQELCGLSQDSWHLIHTKRVQEYRHEVIICYDRRNGTFQCMLKPQIRYHLGDNPTLGPTFNCSISATVCKKELLLFFTKTWTGFIIREDAKALCLLEINIWSECH